VEKNPNQRYPQLKAVSCRATISTGRGFKRNSRSQQSRFLAEPPKPNSKEQKHLQGCAFDLVCRANGKTHLLAPTEPLLPTIQSLQANAKSRDTTERRRRESGAVGVSAHCQAEKGLEETQGSTTTVNSVPPTLKGGRSVPFPAQVSRQFWEQ
jgi:hypothetical protein